MGRLRRDNFADSAVMGTLHASESDLQAIFQMLDESGLASVQQDLVTGSIRASADVEGTIGRPVLHFAVDSDKAVVSGQEIVGVQARGRLDGSMLDLEELSAAQPAGASGEATTGRVRAVAQLNLKDQGYTGTVGVTSWRLDPTPDLPLSGLVGLDYSGNGRGRMVFGKAHLVSTLTVSQDIALGEIVADADLQGDHANITAQAPEFNAVADANIRFDAPYQTTLKANAQALNLARAVSGIRLPVTLDGTADRSSRGRGTAGAMARRARPRCRWRALDGHVQTLPIALREPARVQYDNGRVVVERLEGSVGKTSVSAAGALPLSTPSSGDALLATVSGDLL